MPSPAGMLELINQLPQLLFITQIIFYVFFILFFGSIAVKFYRAYMHWSLKLLLRISIGFLCIISATVISGFFQMLNTGLYALMQADLLIAGLVSAIIFGIGLFFISYKREDAEKLKNIINKLQKRIEKAEKYKYRTINKFSIIGIVVIIGFVTYSLLNFHGLPDINEDIYSITGISEEDLQNISALLGREEIGGVKIPSGCLIEGEFIKCPLSEIQVARAPVE